VWTGEVNYSVLFELFDASLLWFSGSCCWSSIHRCPRILVSQFEHVASLRRHRRAGDATAVPARQETVEENVTIGDVGRDDGRREEDEGQDRLPEVNAIRWRNGDDDVEPEVGKDAPRGGDEEDTKVFDLPDLTVGDDGHAEADDDEQIEGGTADDRAWTKITRLELVANNLDDGQHNLWSGRAESHQS